MEMKDGPVQASISADELASRYISLMLSAPLMDDSFGNALNWLNDVVRTSSGCNHEEKVVAMIRWMEKQFVGK